ncbi:MAG: tetratricopeptide repeat protein [Candidatus Binatia bacterium]
MTGDPAQDYFSDGISDDIITRLARIPDVEVIARNSSFTYKGKAVNVQQVGRELGVRYVLEGSAQKAGDHIRINAQLVNTSTGKHVWVESYDRELKGVFAVQDHITLKIEKFLLVKLSRGQVSLLTSKGTSNVRAWEAAVQGSWHARLIMRESNARARRLYQKALELDPNFALMYAKIGKTHFWDWNKRWSKDPGLSFAKAEELAKKALTLDDSIAEAHSLLGRIYVGKKQYDKALAEANRSLALAPNSPAILTGYASKVAFIGRYEEAVRMMEKALRLDPLHAPHRRRYLPRLYYLVGRYEDAITAARKYLALNRKRGQGSNRRMLVASLVAAGREGEARAEAEKVLELKPNYSARRHVTRSRFWGQLKNQELKEQLIGHLLKAGLPE